MKPAARNRHEKIESNMYEFEIRKKVLLILLQNLSVSYERIETGVHKNRFYWEIMGV